MKILITGANGLLGQKLVSLISSNSEHQLIATGKGGNRNPKPHHTYRYELLDITDGEQVMLVIGEQKPDVVIHTAAMTNVDQSEEEQELCLKLNVQAVQNIVDACVQSNAFLIHLSTDFIFDGTQGPYDEQGITNPISFYGESKLKAEEVIQRSNIDHAIIRTVLVYGIAHDMSRSNIVLWVKKNLEEKKEIFVVNDQWRTPTLAEDLAIGCLLIAQKKAKGIFNISGDELLTPYEMAIRTADFFDLDKSYIIETDGSRFQQKAKRPPKTGFIIEKAKKTLGYKPRSFEEGIAILVKQLKA